MSTRMNRSHLRPSRFVRTVRDGVPRRWVSPQEGHRAAGVLEAGNRFVHRVPAPPSGWQLAIDLPVLPPPQARAVKPVRLSRFLARVTDTLGSVLALTLWEAPSWRSLSSSLDLKSLQPGEWEGSEQEGPVAHPGDLLRIWTWTDLPDEGPPKDRLFVQRIPPSLSPEQREQAGKLLEHFQHHLDQLRAEAEQEAAQHTERSIVASPGSSEEEPS